MESRFNGRWARGEQSLARHFSPTDSSYATYKASADANAQTISGAFITREKTSRRQDNNIGGGWRLVKTRTIRFPSTEANPTPTTVGTFVIGDTKYSVEVANLIEGNRHECELKRVEAGEISRKEYRR